MKNEQIKEFLTLALEDNSATNPRVLGLAFQVLQHLAHTDGKVDPDLIDNEAIATVAVVAIAWFLVLQSRTTDD